MAGVARVPARALRASVSADVEERVADEVPMAIEVDGVVRLRVFATPADLEDLVLGCLLGNGIVAAADDLAGFEATEQEAGLVLRATLRSARAGRPKALVDSLGGERRVGPVEIDHAALVAGMRALAIGQGLWKSTGASHAAGWVSAAGELLVVREDVGRRNALDKLVGAMARAAIDPASGFAAVNQPRQPRHGAPGGRPASACSRHVGTEALAIRVADVAGIALVGFARGDSAALTPTRSGCAGDRHHGLTRIRRLRRCGDVAQVAGPARRSISASSGCSSRA